MPVFEAAADDAGLVRALGLIHDVEWTRGRLSSARAAAERALACAERVGDTDLIARALEVFGAARFFGYVSFSEMQPFLEQSVDWARRAGHRAMEANMVFVAGRIAIEQGSPEEGRQMCEQGIAQLEELGLAVHAAGQRSHVSWGELARDPPTVEERLRQAYKTLKGVGETGLLSTTAASLAIVLARRGALDEAELLTHESEDVGSADDVFTQAGWRLARAMVFARKGQATEAESLAQEALALALWSEYAELTAEAHLGLADVLRLSGWREEASSAATAALAIYEQREMNASAEAVRAELAELQSVGSPPETTRASGAPLTKEASPRGDGQCK